MNGFDTLTNDELFDLLVELQQDPTNDVAQSIAEQALDELVSRGDFTAPDYGGQ